LSLSDGMIQLVGIVITAVSAYTVAKFTRSGAKEANQTIGWSNLVAALQKEVAELSVKEDKTEARIRELDQGNRDLARRVYVLERSRHRWKGWGQMVAEIMKEKGVVFPNPPEPLQDTDPNMDRT